MTREEISTIVERFASLAAVIRDADPADKAEIYKALNLVLTYQPEQRMIRAQAHVSADPHGVMVGVRGASRQLRTWPFGHSRQPYRGSRQEMTCPRSAVSWFSGAWRDGPGGSVDPADDDRVRGSAGVDRGHGVVPAYA